MDCELIADEIEFFVRYTDSEELLCPTPEKASEIQRLIQEFEKGD